MDFKEQHGDMENFAGFAETAAQPEADKRGGCAGLKPHEVMDEVEILKIAPHGSMQERIDHDENALSPGGAELRRESAPGFYRRGVLRRCTEKNLEENIARSIIKKQVFISFFDR